MPKYSMVENENPIFNPIEIASESKSLEAFAQTFGGVQEASLQNLKKVAVEESASMFSSSIADIDKLKREVNVKILKDPTHALDYAKTMQESTALIKENAVVNKEDRQKLNQYIDSSVGQVNFEASREKIEQNKLGAQFDFYAKWPNKMKAYNDLLISNPAEAQTMQNSMLKELKGMVAARIITPHEAFAHVEALTAVNDAAKDVATLYGNPNKTAQDYHTVMASPLNMKETGNAHEPIDENTQWLIDRHMEDKSMLGVRADIMRRILPDPAAFSKLSDGERKQAILMKQGVQEADGIINSGQPLPIIQHQYDQLSSSHHLLNHREEAKKEALGEYLDDLKHGNYQEVSSRTPGGSRIMQAFTAKNSALAQTGLSPEEKAQRFLQNKNEFASNWVAYADAHHQPLNKVRPIPEPDTEMAQASFEAGANPQVALGLMGQYRKDLRVYFANSMKTPLQQSVMNTIQLADKTISPEQQRDFIAANQDGKNYHELIPEDADAKDSQLKALITANLTDQLSFIVKQNGTQQGTLMQQQLIDSAVNYVKFLAVKNSDFKMKKYRDYIESASNLISKSYSLEGGIGYTVNNNQLKLAKPQLDLLSWFAINQGYKEMGFSEDASLLAAKDLNPLTFTITPFNEVVAKDSSNAIAFRAPYSDRLMKLAEKTWREHQIRIRSNEGLEMQTTEDVQSANRGLTSLIGNS